MNNVESLNANSHPFWPVNWPAPPPVQPTYEESQHFYNTLRIDVKESHELDVYRALDEVAFSPSMGVCTPSPRNMAVLNRPHPFRNSNEMFDMNLADHESFFQEIHCPSATNFADSMSSPRMEFSDYTNSTYSNGSTSPELQMERLYHQRNGFKGLYEYAPHVWKHAYPSPEISSEWHGYYHPFHGFHEVRAKWLMMANGVTADRRSWELQTPPQVAQRVRTQQYSAPQRLEVLQSRTNASEKSWQCHPDVCPDGRLKLNARQRRTLKRAETRVLEALQEAIAAERSSV